MKSSQGLVKFCDWSLKSSHDHFALHQEKECHSDHGVRGPQKTHLEAHINTLTWSSGFCGGRGKRAALMQKKNQMPMAKKWCYNKNLMTYFGGREDEDKIKMQHIHFLVHDPSSWSTFGWHPTWDPKDFITLDFLRNQTMAIGLWSWTMGKDHLPWSNVMVHGANGLYVGCL
jgi:hypothetical protein